MPTTITHDTSVLTTQSNVHAFDGRSALASDTLVVGADGFLIATGNGALGVVLNTGPVWKVTINGTVLSQHSDGLLLVGGTGSTPSTITIGSEGSVSGATTGLTLRGAATVKNAGTIASATTAIDINPGSGDHTISNSGLIKGAAAIRALGSFGIEKVTNSGTIEGAVDLGGGADSVTNSGAIENHLFMSFGNDTVANTGKIKGTVNLGSGTNTLTNSGTIGGLVSAEDADTIVNDGTIAGIVNLGDGVNKVQNTGVVDGYIGGINADRLTNEGTVTGTVTLGNGTNTLNNSGIVGGNIIGGKHTDTVTNAGTVTGFIDLGAGNDSFIGGTKAEVLRDNAGSDTSNLGSGNDRYIATRPDGAIDGTDTISSGSGIDTYDARLAKNSVTINIDSVAHDFTPLQPGRDVAAANTAIGTDVAGAHRDKIIGFQNVVAGAGHDIVHGSAAANILEGGAGSDFLGGYAGSDVLIGGAGLDVLHGGAGKDRLTGGSDIDVFRFANAGDSGVGTAKRDVITDFTDRADIIELKFIDANVATAADDAFRFVGTNVNFGGSAGELRARWTADGQIVEGDIDGDRKADFSIEIIDQNHAITLTSADFVL
jgi:Ca2+-binding RTX toxin-like protein